MERKKTSSEVAALLGIKRPSLMSILSRRPHLRPSEKLPSGDYLWDDSEIEAVAKSRRGAGRPASPSATA